MSNSKKLKRALAVAISSAIIASAFNIEVKAEEWEFSHTESIEEFKVPYSGKYTLEVWGAQGGASAVAGGLGGYSKVEIALMENTTLYMVTGGQGTTAGIGGYNGGGDASLGGSGGGATHIATKTGLLKDLTKADLIVVAGGGAGAYERSLPDQDCYDTNWWDGSKNWYKTDAYSLPGLGGGTTGTGAETTSLNGYCEVLQTLAEQTNQFTGYKFGQGESGLAGGGGGLYGGYAGTAHYLSGSGGSGYLAETEFYSESVIGVNSGNGKIKITYDGKLERQITINTNGCGTYNGKAGVTQFNVYMGDTVELLDIDTYDGYTFQGYKDINDIKVEQTFIMGAVDIVLKPIFTAPLVIEQEKDQIDSIKIFIKQDDDYSKYYKIWQSSDGVTWYDAMLGMDVKDGPPSRNKEFGASSEVYEWTVPYTGEYRIRMYGAQGGNAASSAKGGKGAYTEGIVTLTKRTKMYIHVGLQGKSDSSVNTASLAVGHGGKATDIRESEDNVANRIMVAAGGGGGAYYVGSTMNGGAGGALTSAKVGHKNCGSNCSANPANSGATQTRGGYVTWSNSAHDGKSGTHRGTQSKPGTEAGGYGYWCGVSVNNCDNIGPGSGGTSYISGYSGCSVYDGYTFTETIMTSGVRSGDGYMYIDLLSDTNAYGSIADDICFADLAAPNKPKNSSLNRQGEILTIAWEDDGDNGTKYYHKVESYELNTNKVLGTSNILEDYLETGVVGFRYYMDNNSTGTVTELNSTYTTSNKLNINFNDAKNYFHVAAVDGAGNISETYSFEVPTYYEVKYIDAVDNESGEVLGTQNIGREYNTVASGEDLGTDTEANKYYVDYFYSQEFTSTVVKATLDASENTVYRFFKSIPINKKFDINEEEDDTLYNVGNNTYWIKADGKTVYNLILNSEINSIADDTYQIDSTSLNINNENIKWGINKNSNTLSFNNVNNSQNDINIINNIGTRSQDNRTLQITHSFTVDSGKTDKDIVIYPGTSANYTINNNNNNTLTYSSNEINDEKLNITIKPDGIAPVIRGGSSVKEKTCIENDVTFKFNTSDNHSGIREFKINVLNKDNGKIISETFNSDELANDIEMILTKSNSLWIGELEITLEAIDNVGNITKETYTTLTYTLDLDCESLLIEQDDEDFRQGETGELIFWANGYPDYVDIEFPSEIVPFITEKPGILEVIKEDNGKITVRYIYSNLDKSDRNPAEIEVTYFKSPLYITEKDYEIVVSSYKNGIQLDTKEVTINVMDTILGGHLKTYFK